MYVWNCGGRDSQRYDPSSLSISVKPRDVLDMARLYNDEWRRRHVTAEELKVRHLTMNGLMEINFRDNASRQEIACRHTLVHLYGGAAAVRFGF